MLFPLMLLSPALAFNAEPVLWGPCRDTFQEADGRRLKLDPEALPLATIVEVEVRARLGGLPKAPDGTAFPLDAARVERQFCEFEAWKADVYVRSGVYPKRWFGYLDGQWDTREDELVLREVVDRAVPLANAELARQGHAWRLTDQEVIATWLAEGGTLLLGDPRAAAGTLDPIMDIGLDSLVRGFGTWAPLVQIFDREFGSDIGTTVVGDRYRLNFDLTESILGTIIMLCDERALLERKLSEAGRRPQHERSQAHQFILGSLHYNSGLLFSDGRVVMIEGFETGEYLHQVSEKTYPRRPKLNVLPPLDGQSWLLAGNPYPEQWTSWNAVYHVLQRYSSWRSLSLFTDWFDGEGELAPWEAPAPVWREAAPPPAEPVSPRVLEETKPAEGGCQVVPVEGLSLSLLALLGLVRRQPS